MQQLLLVNPKKRPSKRRANKRRAASPRRARRARRSNPISPAAVMRRSRRSARRHHARRRRNPIGAIKAIGAGLGQSVMSGTIGAAGALGAEIITNFLPLPAAMQSGHLRTLAKVGVGVGLGLAAEKFMGRERGRAVVAGVIAVYGFELARGLLATATSGMAGLGEYGSDIVLPYETPTGLPALDGYNTGFAGVTADGEMIVDPSEL